MNKIKTSEVLFRKDLYPRIETSSIKVQQYAETLELLPPIEINQHNELIDGWHRWTAHKKQNIDEIAVIVTQTTSDVHLLELAIEKNAKHGLQLSQGDKRDMARKVYLGTPERDRDEKKIHLAKILAVSERTVRDWLSRIEKDAKEARNKRIFELWLACHTQQEIAEVVGCSEQPIKDVISDISANLPKNLKPAAEHLTDFTMPIYNVWKFKEKSPGPGHFGNTEPTIVDNLLYLYTKPFDLVVDPFAGSGTTIDVCRKRFRRYWVSDRHVEPENEDRIRVHDLMDGLPALPRWKDVGLVYLDPPYWKQAEGKYSDSQNDLANMSLDDFNSKLAGIIIGFAKKLVAGSYIALIIQPTQWKAPEKQYTDHVADMINRVKLPINMRFSCPYESQQCNAQMVEWAKANRKTLVLTRELIVWEKQ